MKNYYAILGLLPSADYTTVRAVYKALMQRHHPDKTGNNNAESLTYIKLLNEAYEVLSDPLKRSEYDKTKFKENQNTDDFLHEEKPVSEDHLEDAWLKAVEYYPDLENLLDDLNKFSWKIGYSFKASMLEQKQFQSRHEIASSIKNEFLKFYFGPEEEIIRFANYLIKNNFKEAAKDLNKTISILGSSISASQIINKVKNKYDINFQEGSEKKDVSDATICFFWFITVAVILCTFVAITS